MYNPEVRLLQFRQDIEKKYPKNRIIPKRKILKQLYSLAIYSITQMEAWHKTRGVHGNICMESFFVENNETIKLIHRARNHDTAYAPPSIEADFHGLAQTIRQIALLNSTKVLDENHHYYPFIFCSELIALGKTHEASIYLLKERQKKTKSHHPSRTETSLITQNPLLSAPTSSTGMPKESPTPFEMVYVSSKKSTSCWSRCCC